MCTRACTRAARVSPAQLPLPRSLRSAPQALRAARKRGLKGPPLDAGQCVKATKLRYRAPCRSEWNGTRPLRQISRIHAVFRPIHGSNPPSDPPSEKCTRMQSHGLERARKTRARGYWWAVSMRRRRSPPQIGGRSRITALGPSPQSRRSRHMVYASIAMPMASARAACKSEFQGPALPWDEVPGSVRISVCEAL